MPCDDCRNEQVFCHLCKYWVPTYYGVGECKGQGQPDSRFWTAGENSRLMTESDFGCRHFVQITPPKKEIL